MKRILLLAAVALLSAPLCVQAQRSEITVSYGYAPTSNWSDSFSAIKDLVSDAKTDISGWGAVTVGYNLRLLGPLSIGAQVVCSTNEQKIKGTNTEIRNRYWAVMPNVKWTWLNLKIVSLYSRAAFRGHADRSAVFWTAARCPVRTKESRLLGSRSGVPSVRRSYACGAGSGSAMTQRVVPKTPRLRRPAM